MKIWVDADAAPRDVKEIVFRASRRLELPVTLVANQRVALPANNPLVTAVWVRGGPDEADRHIVEHAAPGDVAVTADIPLAAALVARGVVALDFRGDVYSEENVRERLSVRDFMASLRDSGIQTGGPAPYGAKDKQAFAAALDRTLVALAKRRRGELEGRSSPRPTMLTIRRYQARDLGDIWELHHLGLHQVGAHAGAGPWDDDFDDIEGVYIQAGGEFVVGIHDERIVAMGALRPSGTERAEIKRMRVHPDHQRQGFGQRIFDALERRAAEAGFRTLHLDTTAKQVAARAFYEKNGFVEVGREPWRDTEMVFYSKRLDAGTASGSSGSQNPKP